MRHNIFPIFLPPVSTSIVVRPAREEASLLLLVSAFCNHTGVDVEDLRTSPLVFNLILSRMV